MPNWTPDIWNYIGQLLGNQALGQKLFWYFEYVMIAGILVGALLCGVFFLYLWIRLAGGPNDEERKKLIQRRNNIGHGFMYLLLSVFALQIFWNMLLPPLIQWVTAGK